MIDSSSGARKKKKSFSTLVFDCPCNKRNVGLSNYRGGRSCIEIITPLNSPLSFQEKKRGSSINNKTKKKESAIYYYRLKNNTIKVYNAACRLCCVEERKFGRGHELFMAKTTFCVCVLLLAECVCGVEERERSEFLLIGCHSNICHSTPVTHNWR